MAVTGTAEYLETQRKTVLDQPAVQVYPGTAPGQAVPVLISAPASMINLKLLCCTAARAFPAVMAEDLLAVFRVVAGFVRGLRHTALPVVTLVALRILYAIKPLLFITTGTTSRLPSVTSCQVRTKLVK
jgi:hypothetical protein